MAAYLSVNKSFVMFFKLCSLRKLFQIDSANKHVFFNHFLITLLFCVPFFILWPDVFLYFIFVVAHSDLWVVIPDCIWDLDRVNEGSPVENDSWPAQLKWSQFSRYFFVSSQSESMSLWQPLSPISNELFGRPHSYHLKGGSGDSVKCFERDRLL